VTKYIRFQSSAGEVYGVLDGETVRVISNDPFRPHTETGEVYRYSDVRPLAPVKPGKILAVGLNYKSHLAGRPQPQHPEMFYKPVSALQGPDAPILIPRDATDVHYEGELVAVIGKQVKNATPQQAREAIFGVTCGNDVSERNWQHGPGKDLQWWRAKGSDTFAPMGPALVTGLDCGNLLLQTRLNGEIVQKQSTADLVFDCAAIVSWVSGWVTLFPGDAIYTGTPGSTRKLSPGDVVEVEIEGVGLLRNPVEAHPAE